MDTIIMVVAGVMGAALGITGSVAGTGETVTTEIAWLPTVMTLLGVLSILLGFGYKFGSAVRDLTKTAENQAELVKELKADMQKGFVDAKNSRKELWNEHRAVEVAHRDLRKDHEYHVKACEARHRMGTGEWLPPGSAGGA